MRKSKLPSRTWGPMLAVKSGCPPHTSKPRHVMMKAPYISMRMLPKLRPTCTVRESEWVCRRRASKAWSLVVKYRANAGSRSGEGKRCLRANIMYYEEIVANGWDDIVGAKNTALSQKNRARLSLLVVAELYAHIDIARTQRHRCAWNETSLCMCVHVCAMRHACVCNETCMCVQ